MLTLPPSVRIYLATEPVDLRKGFEGLGARLSSRRSSATPFPDDQRQCQKCGRHDLKSVGEGKPSTTYEYVPGYFRKRVCRRETLACACGDYIVNAPASSRKCPGISAQVSGTVAQVRPESVPKCRRNQCPSAAGIRSQTHSAGRLRSDA